MQELQYSNNHFEATRDTGPFIGIKNQLISEYKTWWKTSKWWINLVLWSVLIGGIVVLVLTSLPEEQANLETALQLFTLFAWMGTSLGIIVMMQDSVVGEKLSGTSEWVLSKPISRQSFIMSKFVANSTSAFVTMNLVPNLVVYTILIMFDFDVALGKFLLGSLVLYINLVFFLTLTLLSGVIFSSRTPVIGLPIAFLFGQQFVSSIGFDIFYVLPYSIANAVGPGTPLAIEIIAGREIWSIIPIVSTLVSSAVFLLAALYLFDKDEF